MRNFFYFITVFLFTFILPFPSNALNTDDTGHKIDKRGGSKEINAHGACKKVTNNGSLDIFVPTKNAEEWRLFREAAAANRIPGVSISDCCAPWGCDHYGCGNGLPDGCGGIINCGECDPCAATGCSWHNVHPGAGHGYEAPASCYATGHTSCCRPGGSCTSAELGRTYPQCCGYGYIDCIVKCCVNGSSCTFP